MWLQVPFFCGHAAECWLVSEMNSRKGFHFNFTRISNFDSFITIHRKPGSQWALEQAKYNLVNNYFLVGVTEEMEDFIYLLELSLPRFVKCFFFIYLMYYIKH